MFKKVFGYYSDFNFRKLTTPKFIHLFYLIFWPCYIAVFIITEKIAAQSYYNIYSPIDDYIPFCEYFVIPYVLWYSCLAFVGFYGLLFDIKAFKNFHLFLSITCVITFAIYVIWPTEQNLRPQEFARDNIFVDLIKRLYNADTNTNVCPSIHVIFSLGMLFTLWNSKHFSGTASRITAVVIAILICASTVFLKQHSILDVFAGTALSFAFYPIVFKEKRRQNKKTKKEKVFVDKWVPR